MRVRKTESTLDFDSLSPDPGDERVEFVVVELAVDEDVILAVARHENQTASGSPHYFVDRGPLDDVLSGYAASDYPVVVEDD